MQWVTRVFLILHNGVIKLNAVKDGIYTNKFAIEYHHTCMKNNQNAYIDLEKYELKYRK